MTHGGSTSATPGATGLTGPIKQRFAAAKAIADGPLTPSRAAWCYGSPGIARSLWLAGEALDRDAYRYLAVSAMRDVFRRPVASRRIDAPTFCHGVAGLLAIALRFANDTGLPEFVDESCTLVEQLLGSYQPESAAWFLKTAEVENNKTDQPGFAGRGPGSRSLSCWRRPPA